MDISASGSESRHDRRQTFLDAAVRLFQEKGYDQVSYDEIAKSAGVSRPTVFNYFPFKEAMVVEKVGQETIELLINAENELELGKSPLDITRRLLGYLADYLQEKPFLVRPFALGLLRLMGSEERRAHGWRIEEILGELIRLSQNEGLIRPEIPSHKVVFLIMSIFETTAFNWIEMNNNRPLAQELLYNFQLIINGLKLNKPADKKENENLSRQIPITAANKTDTETVNEADSSAKVSLTLNSGSSEIESKSSKDSPLVSEKSAFWAKIWQKIIKIFG